MVVPALKYGKPVINGACHCHPHSKSWWTVATGSGEPEALQDPLLQRALAVLQALLGLRVLAAWKCVQLAVVTLHNASARSAGLERHCVERGLCGSLLQIAAAGARPGCWGWIACAVGSLLGGTGGQGGARLVYCIEACTIGPKPTLSGTNQDKLCP